MLIETETRLIHQDGWTFRVRPPSDAGSHHPVLVMLHGWTGDENSMWIFSRRLPGAYWKIAPRGPINAPEGGFGWIASPPGHPVSLADYKPVVDRLLVQLDRWARDQSLDTRSFDLLGFSQGAFMVYALGLIYPERTRLLGALAAYLPARWVDGIDLKGIRRKRFYLAHGTQDEIIPVEKARETNQLLRTLGSDVTYCEAPIGHKLSAQCLDGLEDFFSQNALSPANKRDQPEKDPQ